MVKICTSADTKDVSLTIYNGGFGAVKEVRTVGLTGEETELVFADVAQLIETDSLLVEGLNVLEFNYDYDKKYGWWIERPVKREDAGHCRLRRKASAFWKIPLQMRYTLIHRLKSYCHCCRPASW